MLNTIRVILKFYFITIVKNVVIVEYFLSHSLCCFEEFLAMIQFIFIDWLSLTHA